METKTGDVSIKKAGEGKATVVIATLGVRDKDGDVLLAGAFGDQVVPVVGAHEWRSVPIGKARIREVGQEAIADIEFNTQTSMGNDWYQAIKFDWDHPPARQQYSWGFTVGPNNAKSGQHNGQTVRFLGASEDGNPLQIHEVSPVLLAAGTNTRSLLVKETADLEVTTIELSDEEKATGWRVQSLLFPTDKWDSADACRSWLRSHDYSGTSVDTTEGHYRFRQADPGRFTGLTTICLAPNRDTSMDNCRIKAIGGPMKESRGVDPEHTSVETATSSALWHVVGIHHTGLDDSPFEPTRHYKRVQASQAAGLYRSAFAVQWPGTSPDMKESWGLLHHVIDDDGKPGAANLHACVTGMSLLKGWDGVFMPEPVREELHAHYAAHLKDGGVDVPDLMKRDSGVELKHELQFWIWLAKSVIDRRARVQEFLIRVGKEESKELVEQFDQLARYVTHMHGVAGSAGDAMQHLEEQEELSQRAAEISRVLAEEELAEEAAKQAELQELFERFRATHG